MTRPCVRRKSSNPARSVDRFGGPKSHLWDDRQPTEADLENLEPVVMPAGSVVFFVGTLWHGGGANRSDAARLCVSAQYCAPRCRTQENYGLSVSRETVKQCSEHIQRMLGYSIHAPFMGFRDGQGMQKKMEKRRRTPRADDRQPGRQPDRREKHSDQQAADAELDGGCHGFVFRVSWGRL